MKAVVLFGEKKPRKENMENFDKLVDRISKSLPEDADVSWYLVRESKVEEVEKKLDTFFSSENFNLVKKSI